MYNEIENEMGVTLLPGNVLVDLQMDEPKFKFSLSFSISAECLQGFFVPILPHQINDQT